MNIDSVCVCLPVCESNEVTICEDLTFKCHFWFAVLLVVVDSGIMCECIYVAPFTSHNELVVYCRIIKTP